MWKKSILLELQTLKEIGTWTEYGNFHTKTSRFRTRGPNGEAILPSQVVLRIKRNEKGYPTKFKARVVAGGNFQIPGEDFDTVFSPVVDFTLVLIILTVVVQYNWFTQQIDVKAAFLNGTIDRETYVGHPSNLPPTMSKSLFYKLNKSLYGLHQSPFCWFSKLREELTQNLGYKQFSSHGAVFIRKKYVQGRLILIIVLSYVDDLIFAGNSLSELQNRSPNF